MNNNIIIDKDLKNEIQTMIQQGTGIDYKSGTCYTPNFDLRELINKIHPDHDSWYYISSDSKEFIDFRKCLDKGDLYEAKNIWKMHLCNQDIIDIHSDNCTGDGDCFWIACVCGQNLDCIKWLYNLSVEINKPFDIHANNDALFKTALSCCDNEIIVWFYELSKQLNKPYDIFLDDANSEFVNEILEYIYCGSFDNVEWLINTFGTERFNNMRFDVANMQHFDKTYIEKIMEKHYIKLIDDGTIDCLEWLTCFCKNNDLNGAIQNHKIEF